MTCDPGQPCLQTYVPPWPFIPGATIAHITQRRNRRTALRQPSRSIGVLAVHWHIPFHQDRISGRWHKRIQQIGTPGQPSPDAAPAVLPHTFLDASQITLTDRVGRCDHLQLCDVHRRHPAIGCHALPQFIPAICVAWTFEPDFAERTPVDGLCRPRKAA